MFQTFRNAWKIPELKNRLLFTLAILVVYRLGSAIPVPFITGSALNQMFSNGNMLSYLDMMSGGALSRCTLFALGVTPYINASIIVQLLTVAIPALENMAKEADGQQKMQQITRYVGGVIALVMSLGYYFVIRNMGALKYTSGAAGIFTAVVIIATFTAGAQLITWCGEQIDDKGIGNGISLLIFSSIVSNWSGVYTTVTGLLTRAAAGETRFYISLEDDLMRLFGGERLQALMNSMGVDENMPIEAKLLSNSIQSAQARIEGMHFEMRKNVLKYDDVMNRQREIIYSQRRRVLDGESVSDSIRKMMQEYITASVQQYLVDEKNHEEWNLDGLRDRFMGWITDENDLRYSLEELRGMSRDDIAQTLLEKAEARYEAQRQLFGESFEEIERVVLLRNVDTLWMDHIDAMEELKRGIGLRGYAQQDPVVAYRLEGFEMFDQMIEGIKENTVKMLLTIRPRPQVEIKREQTLKPLATGEDGTVKKIPMKADKKKPGRNDPCPCGSGLKWKKCTCAQYHPEGSNGGEN